MEVVRKIKEGFKRNIKNPSFIVKWVELVLNFVNIFLWIIPEDSATGHLRSWQNCLFAHAVPSYMIILCAVVLIYLLDVPPGKWFHRVFFLGGAALFAGSGVVGLLNCLKVSTLGLCPMLIAIISLVISLLMVVDVILNEKIFNCLTNKNKKK